VIDVDIAGPIASVTIADGAALSRHDEAAGGALRDALLMCDERDDVKVILISAGPDFCSEVAEHDSVDRPGWYEIYASQTGIYQALCFSKKVTITAVDGGCAGAGSMLVLCSDLTVAARDARFHSPFQDLPEANFVLAALTMRLGRAKAWMLDDRPLDAAAAMAAGLVNRVALADAKSEALVLAKAAAKVPLDGIAMSKLIVESCLDAQGVGQEFDLAGFYAKAPRR
jgi:enoyl-CoA hydratase/carnithine racemase